MKISKLVLFFSLILASQATVAQQYDKKEVAQFYYSSLIGDEQKTPQAKLAKKVAEGAEVKEKHMALWNEIYESVAAVFDEQREWLRGQCDCKDSLYLVYLQYVNEYKEFADKDRKFTSTVLTAKQLKEFETNVERAIENNYENIVPYLDPNLSDLLKSEYISYRFRIHTTYSGHAIYKVNRELMDSVRTAISEWDSHVAQLEDEMRKTYRTILKNRVINDFLPRIENRIVRLSQEIDNIKADKSQYNGVYVSKQEPKRQGEEGYEYTYPYIEENGKYVVHGKCILHSYRKDLYLGELLVSSRASTFDKVVTLNVDHGKLINYTVTGTRKIWEEDPSILSIKNYVEREKARRTRKPVLAESRKMNSNDYYGEGLEVTGGYHEVRSKKDIINELVSLYSFREDYDSILLDTYKNQVNSFQIKPIVRYED